MLTKLLQAQGGAIRPKILSERGNMSENESCKARHEIVMDRINRNEKRLNRFSERLDEVEKKQSAFEVRIDNLIHSIEGLNRALWWALGLGATAMLGFFIRAIERGL